MRIDKYLAHMGFGTRKEVKSLLKSGGTRVNDDVIKSPKVHVDAEHDVITVQGEIVEYRQFIYLMVNKPGDLISATEDADEMTVVDILEPEDHLFHPFPVGRLDKDTEGLLLLTNNGQLSHRLTSPKKEVGKTYVADIEGHVTQEDVEAFSRGVTLDDGYHTKPARLQVIESGEVSRIELVITEGKFHQVKRMFESVGKRVTYLKRTQMGELALDEALDPGEYRELRDEELDYLFELTNME
ncbi:pseudouridine synthase [Thalassobacillus sp. CUG 92003]|uniref:pseudouridine synthase n=1 Tax=Thalassobacillus sp. CUG 92003 TaxID=2736641 RepID=UPI0015E69142|nr:pseudouridine synthase [Thalassobacillus sp. CUG 92003]